MSRKEKYANINNHIHRIFHLLRDTSTFLLEKEEAVERDEEIDLMSTSKLIDKAFAEVLDELASLFSMLTGTECRACIKAIVRRDKKIYVYAFARDNKSRDANYKSDKNRLEKEMDPIEENADFQMLYDDFGPKQRYFFSNDLTIRRDYRSSSFKVYGIPPDEMTWWDKITGFFNKDKWPLPYKSALVWPIQQRESQDFNFERMGCIGFLAVDSESRNVFNKRWDFPIGAGVSDALFHPLNFYKELSEIYGNIKQQKNKGEKDGQSAP